jgi:hypothetical protein
MILAFFTASLFFSFLSLLSSDFSSNISPFFVVVKYLESVIVCQMPGKKIYYQLFLKHPVLYPSWKEQNMISLNQINSANSVCSSYDHDTGAAETRLTDKCKTTNNIHILKYMPLQC